jgi:hypothetical protein
MELFLNRMKSEYCLARALLFQSQVQRGSLKWATESFDGTFTELFEDEDIGIETEFLRTSFRLCFGILDRIGRGICLMLEIVDDQEKVYFDSFWRPPGKNGDTRWNALNEKGNPSLVALYGLARDLNEQAGGEWSRFKRYRNLFEHELCLVRKDVASPEPPFWLGDKPPPSLLRREMNVEAFEMLRFTRAAILYFTFFVRSESRTPHGNDDRGKIIFPKKALGKD